MTAQVSTNYLIEIMQSARQRTLELLDGLSDEQLVGPKLPILNPIIWEIGHVAWFHEFFVLRQEIGHPPLLDRGDVLYDSIAVAHDTRWDLPVYPLREMKDYMARVLDTLTVRLHGGQASERESYLYQFTTFHEDMHDEAFTWARQTLAYPTPTFAPDGKGVQRIAETGALDGDANIPGGMFRLGSRPDDPFVFDNEKWAHDVTVEPFRMARAPVTCRQFVEFVEDGGYERDSLWSEDGLSWRRGRNPKHPVYWKRDTSGIWKVRLFDVWKDLAPDTPVVHVNWHEANAFCNWAGRRLPTEAEWVRAGRYADGTGPSRFPWGDALPPPESFANLADSAAMGLAPNIIADYTDGFRGPAPVGHFEANALGIFDLSGNVAEWTHDRFSTARSTTVELDWMGPETGEVFVIRGSSFLTGTFSALRWAYRDSGREGRQDLGFRLARDVSRGD